MDEITARAMYPYISILLNESERREEEDVLFDMEARARGYVPERTCRMEIDWDYDGDCPAYYRDYVCSECKEDFIYYKNSRVSFCPNCGARVTE